MPVESSEVVQVNKTMLVEKYGMEKIRHYSIDFNVSFCSFISEKGIVIFIKTS